MWRLILISVVTAVIGSYAAAQATEPGAATSPTILILRFETPNDPDGADWIGRAAQEDLATDLTHGTTARIKAPFELKPRADLDSALKGAAEVHATHVVFGQAQSVEDAVRITGQVVDVATGRPLGTIKITGPRRSLFDLEDALTRQVCALLPQSVIKPEMLRTLQENPPAPEIQFDQPEPLPVQIFPAYASPDYSIPERYESAPAIVINVISQPSPFAPGYGSPFGPSAYSPFAYSDYGNPYGWYGPGAFYGPVASGWYPGFNYPFGWVPYGGLVVVNNGFGFHRGFGLHHRDGFGGRGRFNNGGVAAAVGRNGLAGNGVAGNGVAANGVGVSDPVTFRFNADGGSFFQGIPANGFRPAIPAGGFGVGIPRTGFSNFGRMGAPSFRGPAFGNATRGGSAVH